MDNAIENRFWNKVHKTNSCWLWTAAASPRGYGCMGVNGSNKRAHRIAWELTNGPIPDGILVCHHCDNPRCVRPDHLFLGTSQDNTRDALAKGRFKIPVNPPGKTAGSKHGLAKLNEEKVQAIRCEHIQGTTGRDLARKYGVTDAAISLVVLRREWKHVP